MTGEKGRKKRIYTGLVMVLFSLSIIYACARQAKSETVSPAPTSVIKPAVSPAPTPVKKPIVLSQAKAPVQAQEKELGNEPLSLEAPPPVTGLRQFEDPTVLPTPGPPYNEDNTNPHVVMKDIPKEATGVEDWVKAFKDNVIQPHESLDLSKPPVPPFMFDVEIPAVGSMPNVIFPHFPHTFWLDCSNCHPGIFMMKKGGNPVSMVKIVNGEFCGRCHGRVAFPIANCTRCHVKPKE